MTLIDYMDHVQHLLAGMAPEPSSAPPGLQDPGVGEAPPGVGDKVLTILKWVAYLATAACVGGVLYSAGKMALAHRRGDDTNVSQLGWVFAACILIGSAFSIVSALI
ncbi:hypothetical protein [Micromonospora sp. NPDC050695]|uniref:hypothetical protein n=1 Tax=Micromonospora sp. NPDC050695 TaxID=3154938 RepID=UPI0033C002AD